MNQRSLMPENAERTQPQIVCVLGMHRSGTSLVTRMLNLLGLYLGPQEHLFIEPAEDNSKGHWEHREIVKLNDLILEQLGGAWEQPPPLVSGWDTSPTLDSVKQQCRRLIQADFGNSDFWGWKDPRTCLTLPVWQQLLPAMQYVLCVRNPMDVAQSLQFRNGLSIKHGSDLWFSHVSSALHHTATLPRHIVFYEDVMNDWPSELARLASFLGRPDRARQTDVQEGVKELLDREQQHYLTSPIEVLNATGMTFHANALYVALRLGATVQQGASDRGRPPMDLQAFLDAFNQRCERDLHEWGELQGEAERLGQELRAIYNRRIWPWADRVARAYFAVKRFHPFNWLYRNAYALAKRCLPAWLKRRMKAHFFRSASQPQILPAPLLSSRPIARREQPAQVQLPTRRLRKAFATVENAINPDAMDLISSWLAGRVIPRFLPFHTLDRFFQAWEKSGFHLTANHYYSPIPDTGDLQQRHQWNKESELVGLDMNEEYQVHLLKDVFPKFKAEYDRFPQGPTAERDDFYVGNSMFGGTDALVLYCIARHFRPRRIIEVGVGHSTRVFSLAIRENGKTSLTCIDPYPDEVVTRLAAVTKLIEKPVQQVSLNVFEELGPNDICFIDTTHVVKTGGDVPFLYLEVLPRLKPGVLVHFHDIFIPKDYPKEWVLHHKRFWNEQYLLHSFLLFNHEFRVVFANSYMGVRYQSQLRKVFPNSPWWGGASFWVQRRSQMAGEGDGV